MSATASGRDPREISVLAEHENLRRAIAIHIDRFVTRDELRLLEGILRRVAYDNSPWSLLRLVGQLLQIPEAR